MDDEPLMVAVEVLVGTDIDDVNVSVAQASRELSEPGYLRGEVATPYLKSEIFDVNIYGGDNPEKDTAVGISFAIEESEVEDVEGLLETISSHPAVETTERVHYEPQE